MPHEVRRSGSVTLNLSLFLDNSTRSLVNLAAGRATRGHSVRGIHETDIRPRGLEGKAKNTRFADATARRVCGVRIVRPRTAAVLFSVATVCHFSVVRLEDTKLR